MAAEKSYVLKTVQCLRHVGIIGLRLGFPASGIATYRLGTSLFRATVDLRNE